MILQGIQQAVQAAVAAAMLEMRSELQLERAVLRRASSRTKRTAVPSDPHQCQRSQQAAEGTRQPGGC